MIIKGAQLWPFEMNNPFTVNRMNVTLSLICFDIFGQQPNSLDVTFEWTLYLIIWPEGCTVLKLQYLHTLARFGAVAVPLAAAFQTDGYEKINKIESVLYSRCCIRKL